VSVQGFDCGSYPGDDAVTKWANGGSPFSFLGFYLDAPCHSRNAFKPWAGHYQFLKSLGWGLAIVYVGRQVTGCGSQHLDAANGTADATDAITKAHAEGFPAHAVIFLDIEPFDPPVPSGMTAYLSAWLDTFLADGSFEPGIYCHSKNALDLHEIGETRYAEAGRASGAPSFWITRVKSSFDPATSAPSDCGVSFADVWQGQIDISGVTHAGVALDIDFNVATTANPSRA